MDRRARRPDLEPRSTLPIDRRRFLVMMGAAATYVALRPGLGWARKAAKQVAVPVLQRWELPLEPPGDSVGLAHALIGAAVLAPSVWNTQPWRFEVDPGTIRIVADPRRAMPVTDPGQRMMLLSLGAALENLLIAARAYGLHPSVAYLPRGTSSPLVAEVTWTNGDTRRDRALFHAIPQRRTNRRGYDGRGIFPQNRAQLLAQVPDSLRIHWIDDRDALEDLGDVARDAAEERVHDAAAEKEQVAWMRFGDDQAKKRGDGVTVEELGYGVPAHWFAHRWFNPDSWFSRFGAQAAGRRARDGFRSAGAAALITTPGGGHAAWLLGGQAYERFALRATTLGISHQPVCEAIEMEQHRPAILKAFDAAGEEPLMLVRLGHASDPGPSVRRSVELVTSFRTS